MIDWEGILVVDGDFDSLNIVNSSLANDDNEFNYIDTYRFIASNSKKSRGSYTKGVRSVITKDQIKIAESVADYITNIVKQSAYRSNSILEGLEHRLKTEESLNRKFRDWEAAGGNGKYSSKTLKYASEEVRDILRFTVIFDINNFVKNFFIFQDIMEQKGIRFTKIKNTFNSTNTYKVSTHLCLHM